MKDEFGHESDVHLYCKNCAQYRRWHDYWQDDKGEKHCNICGNIMKERVRN